MADINIILDAAPVQAVNGKIGFVTIPEGSFSGLAETIVYTTGSQTISGSKTFYADNYIFSGANVIFTNNTGVVSGQWLFKNLPTSSGNLPQGSLWVDISQGNVLKIII